MADKFIAENFNSFPYHKRSDAQKTEKYFKENIEAGVALCNYDDGMGLRASRRNKLINYQLLNDVVDDEEVQRVLNPFGIEYGKLPEDYQNTPLINSNLMVLFGEERKRFHNPMVTVINNDAITQKLETMNAQVEQFMLSEVTNPTMTQQEVEQEIKKLNEWKNYTYRDKRERMASQVLNYLIPTLDIKSMLSRGFEDLAIAGEQIYIADIVGGEPRAFKGDTVNTITIRSGSSYKIEDSDVIIFDDYVPPGTIIDMYYDELTPAQIKRIEDGSRDNRQAGSGFMQNQLKNDNSFSQYVDAVGIGDIITRANEKGIFAFGGAYDSEGNIRRTRVLWKGMRKIGILTYFDQNGELQKTVVPEQYVPNEELGEMVKWMWISEWYEGTKVGQDIYVKMEPRKVQFRHMDNLSISHPGVVGTIYNVGSQVAKSLVDLAKPYQYLFNAILTSLKRDVSKDKGTMYRLDLSMVPDGWSIDKWMYYAEMMGWQIVNPFNEGNKGAAMGKLAGSMNQNSSSISASHYQSMQQKLLLLDFLSSKVDDIMGITEQRKGAIQSNETLGGVERSVTQSSLRTEKLFALHDNTKVRFYEVLLETAKEAWRGKSFKKSYIMDDMSRAVLDFESTTFNEAEYGVHVTDSSTETQMMDTLKSLAQPFLQNGGSLSLVADLYRTKDPASFQRKLEKYEREMREQAQAQAQAEQATKQAEIEAEKYKIDQDNLTKIEVAHIQAQSKNPDEETEIKRQKVESDRQKSQSEYEIKQKELQETERHNKETEQIDKIKAKSTPKKSQ